MGTGWWAVNVSRMLMSISLPLECLNLVPSTECARQEAILIRVHRAAAIVIIVERSKLVLDFALSLHFIHLVVVTLYTRHLPRNLLWWLALFTASTVAVALATWGCRNRELKPISFGGAAGSATMGDRTDAIELADSFGAVEDEEDGLSRGRGRGRGRDDAGEYEMGSMIGHGGG